MYRYQLSRGEYNRQQPWMLWVMLNPSTADGAQNDPTVRRCIGYANRWRIPGFDVANLYAFRTPYPNGLWSVDDPVGPDNDQYLLELAARADIIMLAWGANPGPKKERGGQVMDLLWPYVKRFRVLGWTKHGEPNHPLMMPKALDPLPCDWATSP
jgi:hypothetical protein